MKPRNKFERDVLQCSKTLPPVTKSQVKWAFRQCISHNAFRLPKGRTTCLDCGHSWTLNKEVVKCQCPQCKAKLQVVNTRARKAEDKAYFTVLTTCSEYQVLRMFLLRVEMAKGCPAQVMTHEVAQYWWNMKGKKAVVGLLRVGGIYLDTFCSFNTMAIRHDNLAYQHISSQALYPRVKFTDTLMRNGLINHNLHGLQPADLISLLLTDSRAETLWKAGQYELLRHYIWAGFNMDGYWPSVKICLRNQYIIQDGGLWQDLINCLSLCGRDIRNAKYICPTNLREEHDRWHAKREQLRAKERAEARREQKRQDEMNYLKAKGRFFGLMFSDDLIRVKVIESVAEMEREGEVMHHCVRDYHNRENSLIMSATIGGKRIETVEVSLKTFQVVQSRGVCNSCTEYHDRIVALVEQNADLIRQRFGSA